MRLVIDGRRLAAERTGVGRYLENLLDEWSRTGPPLPETVVVLADRGGLARIPRLDGLRAEVACEGWPGLAWEHWGLGRKLQHGDLLFAPTNLIPAGWNGRSVLVVFDLLQEVLPQTFPWHVRARFGRRYRRAAACADRIIVPSEATAADLLRMGRVPAGRIRVIAPGVGREFYAAPSDALAARQSLGLGAAPFFLFVGKRSRRRNLGAILDAFFVHLQTFPGHRLVFAGPGSGRPNWAR